MMSCERANQSLQEPQTVEPKYLTQENLLQALPEGFELVGLQKLLCDPRTISSNDLLIVLATGKRVLAETPGPNQQNRAPLAAEWLDYWESQIRLPPAKRPAILNFEDLPRLTDQLGFKPAGILFAAGAEGHPGHRFAVKYIFNCNCQPVLIFEPDENFVALGKARGVPFIPLAYRLAMWSYFPHLAAVSVCPPYQEGDIDDLNRFYQQVFDRTGARYCFAHEDDPHKEEKIKRGAYSNDLIIPNYPVPSTTSRVFRLLPNEDPSLGFMNNHMDPSSPLDQLPIPEYWSYRKCKQLFLAV